MSQPPLKPIIQQVARLFRKHRIDYNQSRQIFKDVRKLNELSAPPPKGGQVEVLSRDELADFLKEAFRASPIKGLMMQTLYDSGLRVDEFCNLRPVDLLVNENRLRVESGKGGKRGYVSLPEPLTRALQIYLNGRTKGYIFESNRHDRYATRSIQYMVQSIGEAAGIPRRVHPHLFRHSKATHLLEDGMRKDFLQSFLRHSKPETTERYVATARPDVQKAFKEHYDGQSVTNRREKV